MHAARVVSILTGTAVTGECNHDAVCLKMTYVVPQVSKSAAFNGLTDVTRRQECVAQHSTSLCLMHTASVADHSTWEFRWQVEDYGSMFSCQANIYTSCARCTGWEPSANAHHPVTVQYTLVLYKLGSIHWTYRFELPVQCRQGLLSTIVRCQVSF